MSGPPIPGAAQRLDLAQVQNDLTEIEEGRFLQIASDDSGSYEFRSEVLPYALGLLVNAELKAEAGKRVLTPTSNSIKSSIQSRVSISSQKSSPPRRDWPASMKLFRRSVGRHSSGRGSPSRTSTTRRSRPWPRMCLRVQMRFSMWPSYRTDDWVARSAMSPFRLC